MQKYLFLFLVVGGQAYGMKLVTNRVCATSSKDAPLKIIVAAWAATEETPFNEQSEVRFWNLPGGSKVSYTARSKGIFDKPCLIKSFIELTPSEGTYSHQLLVQFFNDQLALTETSYGQAWYKHPLVTHGTAVVSTILLMSALFR